MENMNEFKGTKKEWIIPNIQKYNCWIDIENIDGLRIAEVKSYKKTKCPERQEAEANAKLIACAPLMLEMIKVMSVELIGCIKRLKKSGNEVDYQAYHEAILLIKKATE